MLNLISWAALYMPDELTQKNLMDLISTCESLLKRNKTDPLLKRMVIANEKLQTYDNIFYIRLNM